MYRLGPVALPLSADGLEQWNSASLSAALSRLGYPGFVRPSARTPAPNPATVLLAAIAASELEVRVVEALPWLAVRYSDLDWGWLIREAKIRDLQNRLGFIVTLARALAEKRGDAAAAERLRRAGESLDRARLVREDTLCQASLRDAERRWLRQNRTAEAEHWNLLTDLDTG